MFLHCDVDTFDPKSQAHLVASRSSYVLPYPVTVYSRCVN